MYIPVLEKKLNLKGEERESYNRCLNVLPWITIIGSAVLARQMKCPMFLTLPFVNCVSGYPIKQKHNTN